MAFGIFTIGIMAMGIIWLSLASKIEVEDSGEEIEEIKETCLMETIEIPRIEPQGYYNEYGVWVETE